MKQAIGTVVAALVLVVGLIMWGNAQTTINGGRTGLGVFDFSGATETKPVKTGSGAAPGTCNSGDLYLRTGQGSPASQLFFCDPANTQTAIGAAAGLSVSGTYYLTDGTNFYAGFPWLKVTLPPATGTFTGLNATGMTFSNIGGGSAIHIKTQGTSNASQIQNLAAPATPWTKILTVIPFMSYTASGSNDFSAVGISMTAGGSPVKEVVCYFGMGDTAGTAVQSVTFADVTNVTGTEVGTPFRTLTSPNPIVMLRAGDDGTNLTCDVSVDGGNVWRNVYTALETAFLSAKPTNVGPMVYSNGGTGEGIILGYQ